MWMLLVKPMVLGILSITNECLPEEKRELRNYQDSIDQASPNIEDRVLFSQQNILYKEIYERKERQFLGRKEN